MVYELRRERLASGERPPSYGIRGRMARRPAVAGYLYLFSIGALSCGHSPAAPRDTAGLPEEASWGTATDRDAGHASDAEAGPSANATPATAPSSDPGSSASGAAPQKRAPACIGRPPLPASNEVSKPPLSPPARVAIYFDLREVPDPKGAQRHLQLTFTTRDHFSCVGYRLPVNVRRAGDVVRVSLGPVVAPRGPCGAAVSSASGSVTLPPDLNGTFKLDIVRAGVTDRYELAVSPSHVHLKPVRTAFSETYQPSTWTRAPEGAVHLSCMFQSVVPMCVKRAAEGGADCERLFADPEVAKLTPLEMQPGSYMPQWFDEPEGCNALLASGFPEFMAYIREKYAAAYPCVQLTVHTWRGESLPIYPAVPGGP